MPVIWDEVIAHGSRLFQPGATAQSGEGNVRLALVVLAPGLARSGRRAEIPSPPLLRVLPRKRQDVPRRPYAARSPPQPRATGSTVNGRDRHDRRPAADPDPREPAPAPCSPALRGKARARRGQPAA